jgi:transposase InsO family protein
MGENGLNACGRRNCIVTIDSRHGFPVCKNILNREFYAEDAGRTRVSSYRRYAVTCLRTLGGRVFLTVVLDLYGWKVIGWAFSDDMESVHTTIPALEMAFANRKAQENLIFHSDRGV